MKRTWCSANCPNPQLSANDEFVENFIRLYAILCNNTVSVFLPRGWEWDSYDCGNFAEPLIPTQLTIWYVFAGQTSMLLLEESIASVALQLTSEFLIEIALNLVSRGLVLHNVDQMCSMTLLQLIRKRHCYTFSITSHQWLSFEKLLLYHNNYFRCWVSKWLDEWVGE